MFFKCPPAHSGWPSLQTEGYDHDDDDDDDDDDEEEEEEEGHAWDDDLQEKEVELQLSASPVPRLVPRKAGRQIHSAGATAGFTCVYPRFCTFFWNDFALFVFGGNCLSQNSQRDL